jgi:hypothetical protein
MSGAEFEHTLGNTHLAAGPGDCVFALSGNRRSNRALAAFAGADPHRLFDGAHVNFTVPLEAGME